MYILYNYQENDKKYTDQDMVYIILLQGILYFCTMYNCLKLIRSKINSLYHISNTIQRLYLHNIPRGKWQCMSFNAGNYQCNLNISMRYFSMFHILINHSLSINYLHFCISLANKINNLRLNHHYRLNKMYHIALNFKNY